MYNRFHHPVYRTVCIYNFVKKNHWIGPGCLGSFLNISLQSMCTVRIKKGSVKKKIPSNFKINLFKDSKKGKITWFAEKPEKQITNY